MENIRHCCRFIACNVCTSYISEIEQVKIKNRVTCGVKWCGKVRSQNKIVDGDERQVLKGLGLEK